MIIGCFWKLASRFFEAPEPTALKQQPNQQLNHTFISLQLRTQTAKHWKITWSWHQPSITFHPADQDLTLNWSVPFKSNMARQVSKSQVYKYYKISFCYCSNPLFYMWLTQIIMSLSCLFLSNLKSFNSSASNTGIIFKTGPNKISVANVQQVKSGSCSHFL